MVRIAIDAMGGDRAPRDIVSGAVEAARKAEKKYEIILVGDIEQIQRELKQHHFVKDLPISVVHASQKVEMDETPSSVLKKKPDSSIVVAMRLHKEGKVDAVVSAGNTGAVLAAALFLLRPIQGVLRPAVGTFVPHESGVCFLIDAGSNVDCKPSHLLQFGIMGSILVNQLLNIESPRIGLLNIGEESGKGTEAIRNAYKMLSKSGLHFIGNVEGRDILKGRADVIVCDGFDGNILIKFAESLARMISRTMSKTIRGNLPGAVGLYLIRPSLRKLYKLFDYQEYGGAPLLGVRGNCIISHGRSGPRAIRNAVFEAWKMIQEDVTVRIEEHITRMKGAFVES